VAAITCRLYGKSDGLPTLECSGGFQPAAAKTPDGRIWFPTRKGLVAVVPGAIPTNAIPPPVLIEEVMVDGHAVSMPAGSAALMVQPGQGRLEFIYTGLCFTAPDKVLFKHRLSGLEKEWVDAGTQRNATYSYLPPGNYTFHVVACNNDGMWSEIGAGLSLVVLPHFWQTWWFRLFCGFLAAGAVAGAVSLVARRRMRRKMERLERQQALERERARIARDIHDDLGASLTRITMLSQFGHVESDHPQAAAENLDRIYQTARNLTRAMDEIVWAVNPKHDTLDSLAEYLGKFAQDFLKPAGIRCRLELPMQLHPVPLSADSRHNVFLAFKEALNNVVKHSGAAEVRISLASDERGITLIVQDDGRGFTLTAREESTANTDRLSTGNGLLNMRRRMEHIQGQFEIGSTPGAGTTVKFVMAARVESFN
jgi:signal transduction histidine kinase